jgi:hypothetical protein
MKINVILKTVDEENLTYLHKVGMTTTTAVRSGLALLVQNHRAEFRKKFPIARDPDETYQEIDPNYKDFD